MPFNVEKTLLLESDEEVENRYILQVFALITNDLSAVR